LSKKQIILDVCAARNFRRIGAGEIRAIGDELRHRLGQAQKTSASYIASILRAAGRPVDYADRFTDPLQQEPYASRLKGLLEFHSLESAEASLRKLDAIYREYREISDRIGTSLVRSLVLKGKLRAQSVAGNPRVSPEKRREKREIARWFHVWLETPDLLTDWLELRKNSEEFQQMFLRRNGPVR
jgi:transposase